LDPTINGESSLWYKEKTLSLNEASMKVQVEVNGNLDKTDNSSFAFWVTHEQPKFVAGDMPVFDNDFQGFGVLFSKFEAIPGESELSIVVNREKGQTEEPFGCKVSFALLVSKCIRSHNTISMYQISPIFVDGKSTITFKLMIFSDVVFLLHDLYNSGSFYECATASLMFTKDVLAKSNIGFSAIASEGPNKVSQTFTVKEVSVDDAWDAHGELPQHMWDGSGEEHEPGAEPKPIEDDSSVEDQLEKMMLHEWAAEQRLDRLETNLHENLEVKLQDIENKMHEQTSEKVAAQVKGLEDRVYSTAEEELLRRIADLETKVSATVVQTLNEKVVELETQISTLLEDSHADSASALDSAMEKRMAEVDESLQKLLHDTIDAQLGDEDESDREWISKQVREIHTTSSTDLRAVAEGAIEKFSEGAGAGAVGGHWQTAFLVLLAVLLVFLIFAHRWYEHIRKSHLL
jgi:hypothetical protein